MFPLNNHRGQTVGFAGRVMPGGDEKTGKYVNTPETEIYHKGDLLYGLDINRAEIKKLGWAVVVEGEVDAIASWQAGVQNVVAVKGSALTGKQVELLKRLGDRVVLGMDADLAGGSAARRGIEIAEKAGLFVETVDWSEAGEGVKDVADVATTEPDKWRQMAQKVISIYSFYIDTAVKKFGFSAEGKTRAAKDVLQFLDMVSDPVRKDEYLKELAGKTEVDLDVLREQMGKIKSLDPASENKKTDDAEKLPRREMVEEYVVGLALRNKKVKQLISPAVKQLFGTGFWTRVVEHFANSETKLSNAKDLIASLPAELKEKVAELMLLDDEADEEGAEKEWGKAVKDLEEMTIREKITAFLAQGTQTGREKELLQLTRRLNELTKEK
jgi:DNA primase